MTTPLYNVLFLCTGNSARSIMAECILNRRGRGLFEAYSAGSQPTGVVDPGTIRLLEQQGYAVDGVESKSWDVFAVPGAPRLDFVFTVCDRAAAEACPVWPGQPVMAHWGIPDPAAVEGSEAERGLAFAQAYRMLGNRIDAFVSLPVASLDRLRLQSEVERIGRMPE